MTIEAHAARVMGTWRTAHPARRVPVMLYMCWLILVAEHFRPFRRSTPDKGEKT